MNTLDIISYLHFHLVGAILLALIPSFIYLFALGVIEDSEDSYDATGELTIKYKKRASAAYVTVLLLIFTLCLIPTHNKLLSLKIDKIKNEAVTKENVDKGMEHVERVLEKLENKYLGENDE